MSSFSFPEFYGADPANVQWSVVRGDTAKLRIEFYEPDETTPLDVSNWSFLSSTYDIRGDVIDALETNAGVGYVELTAPASTTALWGNGYSRVVAELAFDLQVTLDDQTIWTPVIGTIKVLGDITGGTL